jgi:hypothetical protein
LLLVIVTMQSLTGEPSGRPGTFTLLAGVVLSDQSRDFMGNLVVWPGRHHEVAAHLRDAGADAIFTEGGIQPVDYGNPVQVHAQPGDLLLATYLLPHNIGGNVSNVVRKTIYFRITVTRHENRWREGYGTQVGAGNEHHVPLHSASTHRRRPTVVRYDLSTVLRR